jgi:hypothetical protein
MGTTWDVRGLGILELPSGRSFAVAPCAKLPTTLPSPSLGFTSAFIRPRLFHGNTVDPLAPLLVAPKSRGKRLARRAGRGGRSEHERVEVACRRGYGRTGTALACLAVLDGTRSDQAVVYVRSRQSSRGAETPRQRRFVERFPATSLDER